MDKRLIAAERGNDGACPGCGRRHIHKDDCPVLRLRVDRAPARRVEPAPHTNRVEA